MELARLWLGTPHQLCASPSLPSTTACSSPSSASDTSNSSLPRGSVVLITGNSRTRTSLLGAQAVVRRAVGLGGWHHVVLASGEEVKLQRNALTVLQLADAPSDSSSDTEAPAELDSPVQPRLRLPPQPLTLSLVPELPLFKSTPAAPAAAPDSPAACGSAAAMPRASHYASSAPLVNLHKLETVSLKRYHRTFQLGDVGPSAPKHALVGAVQRHFTAQEVEEQHVLVEFVSSLQRRRKQQQQLLLLQRRCGGSGGAAEAAEHGWAELPQRRLLGLQF